MHYPDLGTVCQIASGPRVRAVGWLSADQPFTRGAFDERVAAATQLLASEGWVHVFAMGPHLCELCEGVRAAANLLVPGDEVLYVAPSMIAHYMRDHEYLPPAEFREAVLACPPPGTDEYFRALKRFVEVFGMREPMTEAAFDRSVAMHRSARAERVAAAAAEAKRKRFTWD